MCCYVFLFLAQNLRTIEPIRLFLIFTSCEEKVLRKDKLRELGKKLKNNK